MIADVMFFDTFSIFSITLIGALVVLSVCGFIGNININSGDGSVNISGVDAQMDFVADSTEKLNTEDASELIINNPVGNVNVVAGDPGVILLVKKLYLPKATPEEEKKRTKDIFAKEVLKKNGGKVEVTVPNMPVMGIMSAKVDLDITVPVAFSLSQVAGVNDICIEDLEGRVELQNNVGNINVKRLKGVVIVHTNSGSITAHELKKVSSLTANAGNISASMLDIPEGSVNIVSHVGNIELDINNVSSEANCQVKSNTGNATVLINREASATIEAVTNMGKLDVDPNIQIVSKGQSFMGGSVVAMVNKQGGKINVSSNTGAISLKLK